MAIIHPYVHHTVVTRSRIVAVSVAAWIVNFLLHVPEFFDPGLALRIVNSLLLVYVGVVIFCQVSVCCEIRRHEKLIAAQQVSEDAKERFLNDQKATKITTAIVVAAVISYVPMCVFRAFLLKFGKHISLNVAYPCQIFIGTLVMFNSFVNCLIYAVRVRAFRVAFIEVLFKRNSHQAEQIEMKLFSKGVAGANTVAATAAGRTAQELLTSGVAAVLMVDRTASSTSPAPAKSSALVAEKRMLSPTPTAAAERPASPTTAVAADKTASPTTAESERAASPTTVAAGVDRAALVETATAAAGEKAASPIAVAEERVSPPAVSEAERTAAPTTTAEAEAQRTASPIAEGEASTTTATVEADRTASPTKEATTEEAASPTAAAAAVATEGAASPTTAVVAEGATSLTTVATAEVPSSSTTAARQPERLPHQKQQRQKKK